MATSTEEAKVPPPIGEPLMTADQYMDLPDDGRRLELVRGKVVEMSPPNFLHGFVCSKINRILGNFGHETGHGYALCNDTAVKTTAGPDSVRGADVSYFSFARLPIDVTIILPEIPPDLVVELVSPGDRRGEILTKVGEYLNVGVMVVLIVYPKSKKVVLYRGDEQAPLTYEDSDTLENLPELPGFRCAVADFFP
ncbi:Uma2 family endonuclease [Isosphaeraceae bacterium EP7]